MEQTKFWKEFTQTLSIILISNFLEENDGEIYLILKKSPIKQYTFLAKKKNEHDYLEFTNKNVDYTCKNTQTLFYRLTTNHTWLYDPKDPNCSKYGSFVRTIYRKGLFLTNADCFIAFYDENHSSMPIFKRTPSDNIFDIPPSKRCHYDIERLYNVVDSFNNYKFFYEKFAIFLLCLKRKSLHFPLLVTNLIVEFSKDHTFIIQTFVEEFEEIYTFGSRVIDFYNISSLENRKKLSNMVHSFSKKIENFE